MLIKRVNSTLAYIASLRLFSFLFDFSQTTIAAYRHTPRSDIEPNGLPALLSTQIAIA